MGDSMREITLDTETTGLDPSAGHRIVEIGCVELSNHVPTGREFQRYVNPEREMPVEAFQVHGLSAEFLKPKPLFADIVDDFLTFIGDDRLVIHNAQFDLGFLNAELQRLGREPLSAVQVVDTVQLARKKHPGAPANLDALCRRFAIDTSTRQNHGALLDAQLLAEVYLQLRGGRQTGLALTAGPAETVTAEPGAAVVVRPARPHGPSEAETAANSAFVDGITDPIWRS